MCRSITARVTLFKEMTGGTTDEKEVSAAINRVIAKHLGNVHAKIKCSVFKKGMHFKVRVSMADIQDAQTMETLSRMKQAILDDLKTTYDSVDLVFVL